MAQKNLLNGTGHGLPDDLRYTLATHPYAIKAWRYITPLARNEFICWVEDAKQAKTRAKRIQRTKAELLGGKRRPCCWSGCIHRKDKPLNPTQKWLQGKRSKN